MLLAAIGIVDKDSAFCIFKYDFYSTTRNIYWREVENTKAISSVFY